MIQPSAKTCSASIQALFQPDERGKVKSQQKGAFERPGDGFTKEEVANAFDPLTCNFDTNREYEDSSIDQLIPGPKAVTFAGRIVNLGTMLGDDPKHPKAAGWHNLIVKDDSAAIGVELSRQWI